MSYKMTTAAGPANRRHTGLIAQDVVDALPEAVYPGGNDMMSVAYGNLAGLFAEAINELTRRVAAIEGWLR
jgi:hypothetical protein